MLFFPVLVFFVISVFSLLHAMSLPGGVSLLWQVFAYTILYFIVINHFGEKEIEAWVLIMTLVGFLHSGYGILQFSGSSRLSRDMTISPTSHFQHWATGTKRPNTCFY